MTILVRLVEHGRCMGCGAIGRTDEKTLLCLCCLDLKIKVADRKAKLTETLSRKWAHTEVLQSIKEKLATFQAQ